MVSSPGEQLPEPKLMPFLEKANGRAKLLRRKDERSPHYPGLKAAAFAEWKK